VYVRREQPRRHRWSLSRAQTQYFNVEDSLFAIATRCSKLKLFELCRLLRRKKDHLSVLLPASAQAAGYAHQPAKCTVSNTNGLRKLHGVAHRVTYLVRSVKLDEGVSCTPLLTLASEVSDMINMHNDSVEAIVNCLLAQTPNSSRLQASEPCSHRNYC
jgi:hypothetical protein